MITNVVLQHIFKRITQAKLLLTSSALVAAASISSYAVADVSVSGALSGHTVQHLQTSLQTVMHKVLTTNLQLSSQIKLIAV